jgi:hypothetical protein
VFVLLSSASVGFSQQDRGVDLSSAAPPPAETINASAPASAAAATATPVSPDMSQAIARAIEDLKTSVNQRLDQVQENMVTRQQLNEAIQVEMTAAMSRFATKAEMAEYAPRTEIDELKKQLATLQESFDDQAVQLNQFRQQMGEQVTTLNDQATQIQQVVNAISRTDSQQRPILDLNSSMQSQEFQQDLSGAVHNSLQRQGELEINNQMTTVQYLRVNGQMYSIPPFTNSKITVPVGTLTTELLGESAKNWSIAPPSYRQGIIIAPRQSSVVVASPVVVYSSF